MFLNPYRQCTATKKVAQGMNVELTKTFVCCSPADLQAGEDKSCCVNKLVVPCAASQKIKPAKFRNAAFQMAVSEGKAQRPADPSEVWNAKLKREARRKLVPEMKGTPCIWVLNHTNTSSARNIAADCRCTRKRPYSLECVRLWRITSG